MGNTFNEDIQAYAGVPDTIDQGDIQRSQGVSRMETSITLPTAPFDGVASMQVAARSSSGEFIGRDIIEFNYDTIVPEIEEDSVTVVNVQQDGRLDELCLVSDCDVDHFVLQVEGGNEITLSASKAEKSECVNDQRTYCFANVFLGIPSSEELNEVTVSVHAVDDQGNPSGPVSFTTRPECQRADKFVGPGGHRLSIATLPDGGPAVAWTVNDGDLRYAEVAIDGEWDANAALLERFPRDTAEVNYGYGLGIDLLIDEEDGEPVVCYIAAELVPGEETEVTGTGVLNVVKRDSTGVWNLLGTREGVRPLGCSLANDANGLAIGWVEEDANSPLLINGRAWWGVIGGGIFPIAELPLPDDVARSSTLVRDLDLYSRDGTLYFAYRTAHPFFFADPSAPGTIVAGYFSRGDVVARVAQIACAPGDNCPDFFDPQPNPGTLGAGPKIVATETSVELAYVAIEDQLIPHWEIDHALVHLRAPLPAPPMEFEFSLAMRQGLPGPVFGLSDDGISADLGDLDVVTVKHSAPDLATSETGDKVFLSSHLGGSGPGGEEITVWTTQVADGSRTRDIVEARVGSSSPGRTSVGAQAIAATGTGYHVAYRNGAANRVVYANSEDTRLFSSQSNDQCSLFWDEISIPEEHLNLTYQHYLSSTPSSDVLASLTNPNCFDTSPAPFPFSLVGFEEDELGREATMLKDIVNGVVLQDGQVPRKLQTHVCVPNPGFSACDPDTGGPDQFTPAVESRRTPSSVSELITGDPRPVIKTIHATRNEADAACPDTGQVVEDLGTGGFLCAVCPMGSSYQPSQDTCVSCSPDAIPQYRFRPVEVPRFLTTDDLALRCVRCPTGSIATSDGLECSQCTDGSQQYRCFADSDCLIFGDDWRCAGSSSWGQRANAPDHRVCVPRCQSDLDCGIGVCDLSDGNGDGILDGVCRSSVNGAEVPMGEDLSCRPIGCDECWQNDYCEGDADCPANHHCHGDDFFEFLPALAPLCVLRPILSPTFVERYGNVLGDRRDEVEAALAEQRERINAILASIRIPDTIEVPLNVFSISNTIHDISAVVGDIRVFIEGAADPARQGFVVVQLTLNNAQVVLEGPFTPFEIVDPWHLDFLFQPHIEERRDVNGNVFSGVELEFVGLRQDGTIDIPLIPDQPLSALTPTLVDLVGPSVSEVASTILGNLGAVESDGSPALERCLFDNLRDDDFVVPDMCPDGSLPEPHLARASASDALLGITLRSCQ